MSQPFTSIAIVTLLMGVATFGEAATPLTADFDTCFGVGASTIRGQFAIEGLAIPEPGDVFVVGAQTVLASTGAPVAVVPGPIFNGAATQSGADPSVLIGTQAAEINRVAGFVDFSAAQGVTCAGGKLNVDWRILSYTQNGQAVDIGGGGAEAPPAHGAASSAPPANGAASTAPPANGAAPTAVTPAVAPPCVCPPGAAPLQATLPVLQKVTTTATKKNLTKAPTTKAPTVAKATTAATAKATTTATVQATTAATAKGTTNAPTTAKATANPGAASTLVNADPVTVTYAGQCSGANAIGLSVTVTKAGAEFKPDAGNPGAGVPCDEYFELSFSFVDAAGRTVAFAPPPNAFFNAKRLQSDANGGQTFAQFTPEVNGFGSGFLALGTSGLSCVNGRPNFTIRTNYLLTALNDGTYNRMLNAVTDAGLFGSGQQATIPANANAFQLGQPQCNVKAATFIPFPFPA